MGNNRILITGGAGFVGHHVVEHLLKNTDADIVVVDKLSYASRGFDRLRDIQAFDEKRVSIITADVAEPFEPGIRKELGPVTHLLHIAAESHVDRSITDPLPFLRSNVLGTHWMLEYARSLPSLKLFLYFSTDEVFGPAPHAVLFKEGDPHNPSNPYSASKAAGEDLCVAYANTYKLPIMITNTMNIFGERQHPEKFIPLCVQKILAGEEVVIHGSSEGVSGSRFYIHARNVADALLFLLKRDNGTGADPREVLSIAHPARGRINIVGEKEISNLDLAKLIANSLDRPLSYRMVDFHSSRPGHDLRYALDGSKITGLGWQPPLSLEASLKKTIQWMTDRHNARWLSFDS